MSQFFFTCLETKGCSLGSSSGLVLLPGYSPRAIALGQFWSNLFRVWAKVQDQSRTKCLFTGNHKSIRKYETIRLHITDNGIFAAVNVSVTNNS